MLSNGPLCRPIYQPGNSIHKQLVKNLDQIFISGTQDQVKRNISQGCIFSWKITPPEVGENNDFQVKINKVLG